jgi:hypothetical protein
MGKFNTYSGPSAADERTATPTKIMHLTIRTMTWALIICTLMKAPPGVLIAMNSMGYESAGHDGVDADHDNSESGIKDDTDVELLFDQVSLITFI